VCSSSSLIDSTRLRLTIQLWPDPNKLSPLDEDIDETREAWEMLARKPFVGEAVREEIMRINAAAKAADALGELYAAKVIEWSLGSLAG